jgi:hypothetical protein
MRIGSWMGATTSVLVMLGSVIAAEPQQRPRCALPANVDLPRGLEPAITRLYGRSPTFRSQCERIAGATDVKVNVRIDAAIPSSCRAFTIVSRRGREIRAEVHLPPSSDHSELLAHEFEHLLEQIEGLDLRRLARVKGSGVREIQRELFETDRAQAAGRAVAMEARRHTRAAD